MNKQREIKFRAWDKKNRKMYFYTFDDLLEGKIYTYPECLDYEWSKFIGLKDKNGKEIYVGDIVKLTDITYQVYYNSKLAKYGLKNPQGLSKFFGGGPEYNPEVVGNIYQNPELLEDEK